MSVAISNNDNFIFSANIIDDIIKSGFSITAMQQFLVNSTYAEEFLEVYKEVLPDYEVENYNP